MHLRSVSTTNYDNIVKSSISDIQIPNISLPDFVFQNFDKWPNKVAIECGDTGKKYTFKEVKQQSKSLSMEFTQKLCMVKEDVIGILLPNIPEYPICFLGALLAGLRVTTLNPLYTSDEIKKQLFSVQAKAIITLTSLVSTVQKCHLELSVIAIKENVMDDLPHGVICFSQLVDRRCSEERDSLHVHETDVAVLPFSSGTTGFPKAVELTHKNIISNVLQISHPELKLSHTTTVNHQDVTIATLPFFHIYGLVVILLGGLYNMCKTVTLTKFQLDRYLAMLTIHKPQVLYMVPYMVNLLTSTAQEIQEQFRDVRTIFVSGAVLTWSDEDKFLQKVGNPIDIIQAYGLTEASPTITMLHPKRKRELRTIGSVGEVVPNARIKIVAICDSSNMPLGPNEPGEILVKGPQVMKGYYNQPCETHTAFAEGWLRTGDIGHYDNNNMLYITGRLKEIIKVKGFQVAPAELEAIIREHPYVLETAVIGVPDAAFGEVPRAYVVLKKDAKEDPNKILQYVAEKTISYKHIKGGIVVVSAIPKTASGKVQRQKLRKQYENRNVLN